MNPLPASYAEVISWTYNSSYGVFNGYTDNSPNHNLNPPCH